MATAQQGENLSMFGAIDVNSHGAPAPAPPPSSLFFGAVTTTNSSGWELVLPRANASGALVLSVAPGSPVEEAGMQAGDVIVAIDTKAIENEEQVKVAQQSSGASQRLFTLLAPDGRTRTVAVKPAPGERRTSADYLERKLADDPDVVVRTLAALVAVDPSRGLNLARELARDVPSFGQAHALVAIHELRAARARQTSPSQDLSEDSVATINSAIRTAIALDSGSLVVRTIAATIALDLGENDRATVEAEHAVAISDMSAESHYLLGLSYLNKQAAEAALPDIHRAATLNPYESTYFEALVSTYTALGREEDSIKTRETLSATLAAAPTSTDRRRYQVLLPLSVVIMIAIASDIARRRHSPITTTGADHVDDAWPVPLQELVLLEVLCSVGAWSMASPASGPFLGVTPRGPLVTELFGRVLPGLAVLVLGLIGLWRLRRSKDAVHTHTLTLGIPAALFICALWMIGTQTTIVLEAIRSNYPDVAAFRLLPGIAAVGLAIRLNLLVADAQSREQLQTAPM